jgi:acyl carrier protein
MRPSQYIPENRRDRKDGFKCGKTAPPNVCARGKHKTQGSLTKELKRAGWGLRRETKNNMSNKKRATKLKEHPASSSNDLLAAVLEWLHDDYHANATESDTTRTLGLDSLDHVEIAMHVEDVINRDIPDE